MDNAFNLNKMKYNAVLKGKNDLIFMFWVKLVKMH